MKILIEMAKEKYEWIKENNPNADPNSIVGAVAYGVPYDKVIDEVTELLENEWGYEGMRDDVAKIMEGDADCLDEDAKQASIPDSYQEPKGEWIVIHTATGETKYQCNQCHHFVKPGDDKNFCPNCGARNIERSEKE